MKIRTDFVTNSSSSHYVIRNISDSVKTMLDLLKETAFASEWHYNYWHLDRETQFRLRTSGNEYIKGQTKDGKKIPAKERQIYLEKVESSEIFPPGVNVEISICLTGHGYGDIFCWDYIFDTYDSESFRIIHLFTAV